MPYAFTLTPREAAIAALLLEGMDNLEIAKQLGIAPRTVKSHFHRMFLRFRIEGGIKRVKLAVMLYGEQQKESAIAAK